MSDTNNRIKWIDTAKGIGLILVIFGHLSIPYLTTWIYTFHMPLFFFLSGFVFTENKYSFDEFCVRKIKTILLPYFVYATIILLFYCIVNICIAPELCIYGKTTDMIKGILVQKHYWTIWFLACLLVVEIFFFVLQKKCRNIKVLTSASFVVALISVLYRRFGGVSLPWNIDVALVAQLFFCLGFVFKKEKKIQAILIRQKGYKFCFLTICLLSINVLFSAISIKLGHRSFDMSVGLYGLEVATLISSVAGILFITMIATRLNWMPITYLGQNTMFIFALHSRIVIVACDYAYKSLNLFQGVDYCSRIFYSFATFFIILITLIPLNECIKKSKIRWLFGV